MSACLDCPHYGGSAPVCCMERKMEAGRETSAAMSQRVVNEMNAALSGPGNRKERRRRAAQERRGK